MNSSADQWWIWRMSRPPRTSNEVCSVEAKASDMSTPFMVAGSPWYVTRPMLGTKNIVRKNPEMIRTTNE
ncbi:hypothetical protein D3C74_459360 [compost metagenome]